MNFSETFLLMLLAFYGFAAIGLTLMKEPAAPPSEPARKPSTKTQAAKESQAPPAPIVPDETPRWKALHDKLTPRQDLNGWIKWNQRKGRTIDWMEKRVNEVDEKFNIPDEST